jgi:hypothetical protein
MLLHLFLMAKYLQHEACGFSRVDNDKRVGSSEAIVPQCTIVCAGNVKLVMLLEEIDVVLAVIIELIDCAKACRENDCSASLGVVTNSCYCGNHS